jgi:putative transposase
MKTADLQKIYAVNSVSTVPHFTTGKRSTEVWMPHTLNGSKRLEEENRKLKTMYADLSLDHRILKEIIEKKL